MLTSLICDRSKNSPSFSFNKKLQITNRTTAQFQYRKVWFMVQTDKKTKNHDNIGWSLLVQWKDSSISWEKLKDLKASNPVKVTKYAIANRIIEEPAFKWWAPHVLCQQNRIISKAKSRYWKTTHKFGILLPITVKEALEINRARNTDFWRKAVNKEIAKDKIAWKTHNSFMPQQS
jgi:hypothetical protein